MSIQYITRIRTMLILVSKINNKLKIFNVNSDRENRDLSSLLEGE